MVAAVVDTVAVADTVAAVDTVVVVDTEEEAAMEVAAAEISEQICVASIFRRNNWYLSRRIFTWSIPMLQNEAKRTLPTGEPPSRL